MIFSTLSTLTLALLTFSPPASAEASTQKLGWSGTLSSLDGGLGGTVIVVDASTLRIDNYALADGSAPALYWWGSTTDDLGSGFRISQAQVTGAATTDTLTVNLDAGKTPDDFATVGLWCERFSADFGQARLSQGGSSGSTTGTAGTVPTAPVKPGAAVLNVVSKGALGALALAAVLASWVV